MAGISTAAKILAAAGGLVAAVVFGAGTAHAAGVLPPANPPAGGVASLAATPDNTGYYLLGAAYLGGAA